MDAMKDESNSNLQQNPPQTIKAGYSQAYYPTTSSNSCCGSFT
jgi:hypothetical protein